MDYTKILNNTVQEIQPSGIRKFFDIVAEQKNAISLGVGEPDLDTPWNGRNAAIKSLRNGQTHYTSNRGTNELRAAISKYYEIRYGLKYDPNKEVVCTVGASEGIDLSLRALITPGDEVIVPDPSYVSYYPCVKLAGGIPVAIECTDTNGFILTKEQLEKVITPKTRVLIFPYPNNPTGGIMTKEQLEEIIDTIIKHNLIVISDEIYSELTYGDQNHVSIASLPGMRERTIVLNGFSKSFAMTGWRLGYALAPEEISFAMYKIHQYTIMCAPTMSQVAALEILEEELKNGFEAVTEMYNEYNMRRKYVYNTLQDLGFEVFEPRGAFYIFPSVKKFGLTGEQFAEKLLEKEKVAVVPGNAFGKSGEYHIRISYAYSMQNLTKAFEKIKHFIDNL